MTDYSFLTKLQSGEACYGMMAFEFMTPGLPSIVKECGADFLILDTEHSGCGIETIKQQVASARGLDLYPIARVTGSHYHLIAPMLDAGAKGIMVPSVSSAKKAEKIAQFCRYRPEGTRGLGLNLAHDHYTAGEPLEKLKKANSENIVIIQIETREGLEEVEQIMALPGVDVAWLGHFDLTDSLGIPGQFDHPEFQSAVDRIVDACIKNGKAAGFLDMNPERVKNFRERGYQLLGYGHDVMIFQQALRQGLSQIRGKEN
jgi:2-keto-3-deoxy-L-rhamnonate aldolase RhmA